MERGLSGWTAAGHALESGEVDVDARSFEPDIRQGLTIDTDEVVSLLDTPSAFTLVDARDASRFRGESEPIDPVAGHIPGASNLPFTDLLDDRGSFLPLEELRERFANVLGDDASNWAVMCGSGVTACHLAVAAVLAGVEEPKLYTGSWSEWIRDPERPISTGE